MALVREKSALVELDAKLASRAVNEGFSGGEKKRNEIFQMAMLDPKNPAEAAEIQAIQQQLQMLKLLAGTGTMRGAGISIQDVPDEA